VTSLEVTGSRDGFLSVNGTISSGPIFSLWASKFTVLKECFHCCLCLSWKPRSTEPPESDTHFSLPLCDVTGWFNSILTSQLFNAFQFLDNLVLIWYLSQISLSVLRACWWTSFCDILVHMFPLIVKDKLPTWMCWLSYFLCNIHIFPVNPNSEISEISKTDDNKPEVFI
jgi:hypothetical protein